MRRTLNIAVLLGFFTLIPVVTHAAVGYEESIVSFPIAGNVEGGSVQNIRGTLRIPNSGDKLPAIVIIHSYGQDMTGQAYAIA